MTVDHVALLPIYCAAGTALLAFLADMVVPGKRGPVLTLTALGAAATAVAAWWTPSRKTFCTPVGCSLSWDARASVIGLTIAAVTFAVVLLSTPLLRSRGVPSGEYCFLLGCSMTGGVVLGAAGDLITLIVALETLTLPLYILVGLRRRSPESAEAAVTFFLVSVASTAVTLLGVALLYSVTGTVHLSALAGTTPGSEPIERVAVVLILAGLAFKVAAVPFHAWAPATYDGAPLPVAAYLSTASKVGGVVALLLVVVDGLAPWRSVTVPALAVLAVATMTVGNLVALRQRRMVRLLAWSSIAQAGYILAPFAAWAGDNTATVSAAILGYTILFVLLEVGAFAAVIALRGDGQGGDLADYAGAARSRPLASAALVVALVGLAGLPPGFAGLFAKIAVVRALLDGGTGWLAVVVAVNAVVALAYYVRAAGALFAPVTPVAPITPVTLVEPVVSVASVMPGSAAAASPGSASGASGASGASAVSMGSAAGSVASAGSPGGWPRVAWPVGLAVAAVAVAGLVFGLAPQLVLAGFGG